MDESTAQGRLTSRSIRSFVIRNGRLTKAQASAMERLLPRFGVNFNPDQPLDFVSLFGNSNPVWLEIGFGNGDALLDMASSHPQVNFVGVEVHEPGVGHALIGIESNGLSNVRIIQHDALEVLEAMVPRESLDRVLLFFPDPWRKKRHFKRRIVQDEFLSLVASRLTLAGILHCATDWSDYAQWMLEHLEASEQLNNTATDGKFVPRPDWRVKTRFEQRGERLGHQVFDLVYTRCQA